MNFKGLFSLLSLLLISQVYGQAPANISSDSVFQPKRLVAIGCTPITTTNIPSIFLEVGYTLSPKVQVFGGPKFYVTNYGPYVNSTNPFGSFYGGYGGFRGWWKGMPKFGWTYFSSLELHLFIQKIPGSTFFRPRERRLLGPEIGNGFGRFSQNGFFFLFNFNFGAEIKLTGQASGDVYGAMRLAAGFRF